MANRKKNCKLLLTSSRMSRRVQGSTSACETQRLLWIPNSHNKKYVRLLCVLCLDIGPQLSGHLKPRHHLASADSSQLRRQALRGKKALSSFLHRLNIDTSALATNTLSSYSALDALLLSILTTNCETRPSYFDYKAVPALRGRYKSRPFQTSYELPQSNHVGDSS